jgi:hypothetical protein
LASFQLLEALGNILVRGHYLANAQKLA